MIRYALPDMSKRLSLNLMFAEMARTAPELFLEDIRLDSVYGNFPGCIMNGGRLISGERYSEKQINGTFDRIAEAGMIPRLTFTNLLVGPEHFGDAYANTILKAGKARNAEVIVYSDELADYITEHYGMKLILSTSRPLDGVEELNRMLDRYSMVVLDYMHNKDDAFLRQVSDPTRLEVMPNELCKPDCPLRRAHYEAVSRLQLDSTAPDFACGGETEKWDYSGRTAQSRTILGNDDVRRLNSTYGIEHFKIVGRNGPLNYYTESYLYYLIRPEFHGTVYKIMKNKIEQGQGEGWL